MASACQIIPSDGAFAQGVLAFFDCQARTLGAGGYASLASAASGTSLILSSLLTVFIAIFGLRLMLGYPIGLRDGVLAIVKVGIVLTLATSWPAYQVLVYNVVLAGPADLASQIGATGGLPGSSGGLVARLDGVDATFRQLAILDVGVPPPATDASGALQRYPPPLFSGFDTFAIGASRAVFLAAAIGAFALLRVGAGILLALGPLFIIFLLFDTTRGLLEGWIRALVATSLGSIAAAISLGVELALIEPWLTDLLARRATGLAIPGVPVQLLAITIVFAMVIAGLIRLTSRLAFSFRFPATSGAAFARQAASSTGLGLSSFSTLRETSELETRSRAATVAAAILASQRRETLLSDSSEGTRMLVNRTQSVGNHGPSDGGSFTPLGSSFRRTAGRISSAARTRDIGS